MKRTSLFVLWGLLLIAAGILGLLQAFNVIGSQETWGVVWGIIFAIAGMAFMWWFLNDIAESWWAVIPGLTLLALAVLIAAGRLGLAENNGAWLGGFFLGAIALSFWIIYFVRREHWWAVIPGGALLTVAAIATLSGWIDNGLVLGSTLFFGLALTFVLVYLLPTPQGHMVWALVPAGVFVVLGLLVALSFAQAINYVWAVALILAGVYLLYRQGGSGIARHR